MASYAVLGATGNTGTSLIQNILRKPDAKVHAYCRNKNKLLRLLPEIVDNKDVQIFEGSIHDKDLITECIRGTRAAFLVVTTNTNVPGCCMAQDVTRTVLAALEKIKSEGPLGYPLPKVVLLSSATIDDHLARKMPGWFRPIMLRAGSFVYDDLRTAEALLRAEEAWLSSIFIKPGGLAVDQQRGHVLNMDEEESFISFLDLAAAMLEAADDPEARYDMKNVSVTNANGAAAFPKKTVLCILTGLLRHYFPYLHPYLPEGTPC